MTAQVTQLQLDESIINFGIGQPDFNLLPYEQLHLDAANFQAIIDRGHLNYGLEAGDAAFRETLCEFMQINYQTRCSIEELFITNGVSQGLDLLCTLLARAGDIIFVEEPTYFLALELFRDHHFHIVSIPMEEDGLNLQELESALDKYQPVFLYTIPVFHNPTGRTMSTEKRLRLMELSKEHDFWIFADEVYHPLAYSSETPFSFAEHTAESKVISLGSFSKILAPGLRLGWIKSSRRIHKRLTQAGLLQSGGGINPIPGAIVHSWLRSGMQSEHLRLLCKTYAAREEQLWAACTEYLTPYADFQKPRGGFFIWLELFNEFDTGRLREIARGKGVDFQLGENFSTTGASKKGIRLCFAFYEEASLREGIRRLEGVFKEVF